MCPTPLDPAEMPHNPTIRCIYCMRSVPLRSPCCNVREHWREVEAYDRARDAIEGPLACGRGRSR